MHPSATVKKRRSRERGRRPPIDASVGNFTKRSQRDGREEARCFGQQLFKKETKPERGRRGGHRSMLQSTTLKEEEEDARERGRRG